MSLSSFFSVVSLYTALTAIQWNNSSKFFAEIVNSIIFLACKHKRIYIVQRLGSLMDMYRLRMVKNTNFFWDSKKLILTYWKTVFWVTEHFCIKWTFWKNVIFCPKNAFFWQKWQFDPLARAGPSWCQGTFFPLIFFYLNSEGFVGGRWRRWWNLPLIIFNWARTGPFLEDLKKKSFQKWLWLESYT